MEFRCFINYQGFILDDVLKHRPTSNAPPPNMDIVLFFFIPKTKLMKLYLFILYNASLISWITTEYKQKQHLQK